MFWQRTRQTLYAGSSDWPQGDKELLENWRCRLLPRRKVCMTPSPTMAVHGWKELECSKLNAPQSGLRHATGI